MTDRIAEVLDIVRRACALGEYDSNVIGMAAEIIAEDAFGMTKVSRGSKDIDGYWSRGNEPRTVQVKAWSEARIRKYRLGTFLRISETSPPDDLLVLLIYSSKASFEVLYNGPSNEVGYIEKNGLNRVIRLDAMRPTHKLDSLIGDNGVAEPYAQPDTAR